LSFYFGYLGLGGKWDNSTQTTTVAGALAEVVASVTSLQVYYDFDGVAGFHWDITQTDPTKKRDIYNCDNAAAGKYDCVDASASLDLKTLDWTPIDHTKIKCNSIAALADYPDGCEIHSLTTSGHTIAAPTAKIIEFTIRIASQPVKINNIPHGPDYAKWDVTVNFPWASYTTLKANPRLALVTVAAGKSGVFVGSATRNDDGSNSLNFAAEGNKARAYYGYSSMATIDGASAPITTQVITGQQVLNFNCDLTSPCAGLTGTNLLVTALKYPIGIWAVLGWKTSIAIHTLGNNPQPGVVFWDPVTGAGDGSSPAAIAVPSALLVLLAFFY